MNKYIETLAEKLEDYKSESGPILADGLDDAVEHFEFNVAGAYVGKQTPIFLERL